MNIFQPVVSFLRWAALKLSEADGKPQLTAGDIHAIVNKVVEVQTLFRSERGPERAARVAQWIGENIGNRLPEWARRPLVYVCWLIAHKKGLLK